MDALEILRVNVWSSIDCSPKQVIEMSGVSVFCLIHSESRQGKDISSHPKTSRPALGLTQTSIHSYRGTFPGAKWPRRETGYPSSSSMEINNG